MSVGIDDVRQLHHHAHFSVSGDHKDEPLRECVRNALERYLDQIGSHRASGLYDMVLREVEPPVLEAVMQHCRGNQTRAAQMLGISRSTLRKKLASYQIDNWSTAT